METLGDCTRRIIQKYVSLVLRWQSENMSLMRGYPTAGPRAGLLMGPLRLILETAAAQAATALAPCPAARPRRRRRSFMMRGPAPPTPRRSRGAPSVLRPGRCGGAFKWRPRPPAREVTVEDAQIAPRRPKRGLGPAKCRAGESKGADSPDGRAQWSSCRPTETLLEVGMKAEASARPQPW